MATSIVRDRELAGAISSACLGLRIYGHLDPASKGKRAKLNVICGVRPVSCARALRPAFETGAAALGDLSVDVDMMGSMSGAVELPLTDALRNEYRMMHVQLERGRERAARLRELAEQAADQVVADERMLRSLAELLGISRQATIDELGGALRGERLREVAVAILLRHRAPGAEVHYREWYDLLTAEGVAVAGKDPVATFLAQISRADQVEAVGRRSGRYRLLAAS